MASNTRTRTATATVAATPVAITVDVSKGTITGVTTAMVADWLTTARTVKYDVVTVGSIVTTFVGTQRFSGVVTSSSVNSRNVRTVSIWVINPETGTFAMSPVTAKDGTVGMGRVRLPAVPTTHITVNVAAPVVAGKVAKAKVAAPYVAFGR